MNEIEKTKQDFKDSFKHALSAKGMTKVIYVVCIVILASVIFQAGVFVGFHKAQFNGAWGEHYERNFGSRQRGFMGNMMGSIPDQYTNGHGTIGKILKIELPSIIVLDNDNTEKVIITDDDTDVINLGEEIKIGDLKISDQIVVIGTPNDQGQIIAKFIRVLPRVVTTPVIAPQQ